MSRNDSYDNDNDNRRSDRSQDQDQYRFDIRDGLVVGVQEWDDGRWKNERIDADETYTLDGRDVLKTEWEHGYNEITRYSDPENDGLYVEVSETRVNPNTNTNTNPRPPSHDADDNTSYGSYGNERIEVHANQAPVFGGAGADTFVVRDLGHVVIGDFHHNQNDRLVFDTSTGIDSLSALAQRLTDLRWQGDDLVIELGEQASVTLLGVRINGIGVEDIDTLS